MIGVIEMTKRMVRSVATRGRILAMGSVGAIGVIIAVVVARADQDATFVPAELLSDFGLLLFVPLVVLVVSSATLGTLIEEKTLVYFWLRPIGRWQIALAAFVAGLIVAVPLVFVPMIAMAAIVGDSSDVTGIAMASAVGTVGYTSVFTMLGLLTKRALAWGLAYLLVWEGFVAGLSRTAGWLALRTYATSTLGRVAEVPELIDDPVSGSTIAIVMAATAIAAFGLTTLRLRTMSVD